jgi:hypothetical protein
MQRDLFPRASFSITPETGRKGPRLWVRRLVIWREPGAIIRSIELKPGLNIVWSPDPGSAQAGPIGHGAGKTMFCRLLRYCLGEDSFAPEGQRHRMSDKLPNGSVGAEVLLDGQPWVVVRALGPRRHDVVIKGGSLEEASQAGASATGIAPLRDSIVSAVLQGAGKLFPPTIGEPAVWEATLAWLTRDQECRFGGHLDWRDPHRDSRSPVRGRSMEERLAVVRALIGALTDTEIAAQRKEEDEDKAEKRLRSEVDRLDWQIGRSRGSLARLLGSPTEAAIGLELDAAYFKAGAAARYAEALKLPIGTAITSLEGARGDRDRAAGELRQKEALLSNVSTRIEEKIRTLVMLRSELPESRARWITENNPVCPICAVPIDKAVAEGCSISTATCDLHALQHQIANLKGNVDREAQDIEALEGQRSRLQYDLGVARQRLTPLEQAVAALERSLIDQSNAVRAAQRLADDADRHEKLLIDRANQVSTLERATAQLSSRRDELSAHRQSARESIARLSLAFDAVLKELVPSDIEGEAKLDGNGLSLTAKLDGERSTAAIDSLKVVAFDLAALILTMGATVAYPVSSSTIALEKRISAVRSMIVFSSLQESSKASVLLRYFNTL